MYTPIFIWMSGNDNTWWRILVYHFVKNQMWALSWKCWNVFIFNFFYFDNTVIWTKIFMYINKQLKMYSLTQKQSVWVIVSTAFITCTLLVWYWETLKQSINEFEITTLIKKIINSIQNPTALVLHWWWPSRRRKRRQGTGI